jgi:hypothetical protein
MLGEIVGDSLWLSEIERIEETENLVSVPCLMKNADVWARVTRRLRIQLEAIRFIYSSHIGLPFSNRDRVCHSPKYKAPEIVGFRFWNHPSKHNTTKILHDAIVHNRI